MPFNQDKLNSFLKKNKKKGGAGVRTGGKGTVRRKRKAVRKGGAHDDKRLKSTLNKLNVRDIPAIEEVNFFKEDGNVIHFTNPKLQASIAANTYVVSGNPETKPLQDLLPGIINQLGPDNLDQVKEIYSQLAAKEAGKQDNDDDVPDLVANFEDVSNANAEDDDDDDDDVPDLVQS